jgi:hypothetical protein
LSTHAHIAALVALHAVRSSDLLRQLPDIRDRLSEALTGLEADPTPARCGLVAIQIGGAERYLQKLREALTREAGESDGSR